MSLILNTNLAGGSQSNSIDNVVGSTDGRFTIMIMPLSVSSSMNREVYFTADIY